MSSNAKPEDEAKIAEYLSLHYERTVSLAELTQETGFSQQKCTNHLRRLKESGRAHNPSPGWWQVATDSARLANQESVGQWFKLLRVGRTKDGSTSCIGEDHRTYIVSEL